MSAARKSNFELLRILSMLLIIAHHFSVHGAFADTVTTLTVGHVWAQCMEIGGKLGVNIFVLISGYFLCTSDRLKIGKVIKLLSQVVLYSVGLYVVTTIISPDLHLTVKSALRACFPITYGEWWFASTYFVLFLLSPYLNKLLATLTPAAHRGMLVLLFVCWSVIPAIFDRSYQSNHLLWFVFLYAVAAYIRKNETAFSLSGKRGLWLTGAAFLVAFSLVVVFDLLGGDFAKEATRHFEMQQPMMLAMAVLMFITFKNLSIPYLPAINFISQTTFGIYLLHDYDVIRRLLWRDWLAGADHVSSPYFIPYSLLCVIAVFVMGALVELLRIYAFERWWMRLVDRAIDRLSARRAKD